MSAPWSKVAVGDLLAHPLRNGISPSNKGKVTAEVLTLSAVTGSRFDPGARKTARFESQHAQEKTVRKADLLICRGNGNIGLVGRARRPRADMPDVAFPDTMIGASFDLDRINLTFLEYLWDSHVVRSQVEESARSTNGTHKINQGMVESIEIPLPPIEEQRRIAAVLDAADELRAKRREALAKLDTLTQAIFIDMFGSPGDNPRRWPVQPLIELVDPGRPITYGILKPGDDIPDGVPYVRVVDMAGGRVLEGALRRTTPEIAHQYRRSTLPEGDLLLSIRGHVGRMAQVHGGLVGANITQDTARLAIVGARPEYVFACMQAEESQRWMANFMKGAAVRGINLTDVKKLPVPVPPADLQGTFAERVARATAHVKRCTASQSQLDSLFASLQQRAFRGEL